MLQTSFSIDFLFGSIWTNTLDESSCKSEKVSLTPSDFNGTGSSSSEELSLEIFFCFFCRGFLNTSRSAFDDDEETGSSTTFYSRLLSIILLPAGTCNFFLFCLHPVKGFGYSDVNFSSCSKSFSTPVTTTGTLVVCLGGSALNVFLSVKWKIPDLLDPAITSHAYLRLSSPSVPSTKKEKHILGLLEISSLIGLFPFP